MTASFLGGNRSMKPASHHLNFLVLQIGGHRFRSTVLAGVNIVPSNV